MSFWTRFWALVLLSRLLADPTINDILVNSHRSVFVERAGRAGKDQGPFS